MRFSDNDFNFREVINKIVIIKNVQIGEQLASDKKKEKSDAILCYCYIDEECGISFEYLADYITDNEKVFNNLKKDTMYKIRFENVKDDEYLIYKKDKTEIEDIDTKIDMIVEGYDKNEGTKELRTYPIFDHLRVKGYPDDCELYLVKEGLNTEKLFVKLYKTEENRTFGKLLNEPFQNFGVHRNDIIEIFTVKYQSGEIILVHQCK